MTRAFQAISFGGSVPRRARHLTPVGQAARAVDCRLEDGTLQSWREPRLANVVPAGTRSVYQAHGCCTLTSTCPNTSWAEGSPEVQAHVFATQYNDKPWPVRVVLDELCNPTVYRLGLPCPHGRITPVPASTPPGKDSAARQYVFRWRDSFCNESSTSEVSVSLVVPDGTPVQLSGWVLPPTAQEWDIQQVAIYRSVSGFESATQVSANKIDAAWMLVGVVPATAVSFVDNKRDVDLYEAMSDDVVEPPPEDLQGMAWIESLNALVGFAGRRVFFTKNRQPHNWAYHLLLDDRVKGLAESNGTVYVATDGAPYVIAAESDCENAGCRRATRMPEALPLVGCCTSVTAVPGGAVYPSHDGLVLMQGRGVPGLVTASHYAPSHWQALHPDTVKPVYHMGRLFVFARKGAFVMALKLGATAEAADLAHHSELSMRPSAVWVTRTGRLMMLNGVSVSEWDRGAGLIPHRYEIGERLASVPIGMGAAQVLMEPGYETLTVEVDGATVAIDTFHTSDTVSLPRWAEGQLWTMVLAGTARVKMASIAPSSKEL